MNANTDATDKDTVRAAAKERARAFAKFIGSRLRLARDVRKMSQGDVAELLGCTRANVAHIEAGRQAPTPVQMRVLAEHFGVRVDDLYPPSGAGRIAA